MEDPCPPTHCHARTQHGLGTHATSHVRLHLPPDAERFVAQVGIDDNYDTGGVRGSVTFAVRDSERELAASPVLRGSDGPLVVDVPVAGLSAVDLHVTNGGDGDSHDQCDWADAALVRRDDGRLWLDELPILDATWLSGSPPFSFRLDGKPSGDQTAWLSAGGGPSSNRNLPFFNLDLVGRGLVVGVGWSGQWRADFAPGGVGRLSAKAGMERTRLRLRPGERIRSPRILVVPWEGDRLRGHNLLRQVIYRHYTPLVDGKKPLPGIQCNTWFPVGGDGELSLSWSPNEAAIAQAQSLDGRYLLITNTTSTPDEVFAAYKRQHVVESNFRTFKSGLQVHPIYLANERRIRGLVLMVILALLIYSLLELVSVRRQVPGEHRHKLTARAILPKAGTLAMSRVHLPGQVPRWQLQFNRSQQDLWQDLGFPSPLTWLNG